MGGDEAFFLLRKHKHPTPCLKNDRMRHLVALLQVRDGFLCQADNIRKWTNKFEGHTDKMFMCSWSASAIQTPDAHLVSRMFYEYCSFSCIWVWNLSVALQEDEDAWGTFNPLALEMDIYSLAHHLCTVQCEYFMNQEG